MAHQEYALAHEALSRLGTRLTPQALAPAGGRAGDSSSLLDGDRAVLVRARHARWGLSRMQQGKGACHALPFTGRQPKALVSSS